MKTKLFLSIVLLCLLFTFSYANAVTVIAEWNPNTESDLAGYKLYYGTSSGNYTTTIDVGNVVTHTIPDLATGAIYYFAVTAYDTSDNESGYSNEASLDLMAPLPPDGCKVRKVEIE